MAIGVPIVAVLGALITVVVATTELTVKVTVFVSHTFVEVSTTQSESV
jgi:hypothetical protein